MKIKNKMKKYSIVLAALFVSACTSSPSDGLDHSSVEVKSEIAPKRSAMVVTANPHATKAGADILRAGGSAVDLSLIHI